MQLIPFKINLLFDDKARIVAIGRGNKDLKEFCKRYDAVDRIRVMLNDNPREHKDIKIETRTIEVRDFSYLRDILGEGEKQCENIIVIMDDYFKEVFATLSDDRIICSSDVNVYYYLNYENEIEFRYRDAYKGASLEDLVVFRSGPHPSQYVKGMDFDDNARALFEHMLSAGINEKYELVWIVKNPAEFARFERFEGVRFLSYEWAHDGTKDQMDAYYHALCCAKYIFFTDAYGFARNCREDQMRIQLWHGCGYKSRVNFTRCEHRYEKMVVTGLAYKEIHARLFGLRDDQLVVTGCPKEDWLFHPAKIWIEHFMNKKAAKKVIFWLPTFREAAGEHLSNLNEYAMVGDTGLPVADTQEKLEKLNELLVKNSTVIVIKLHPYQKREKVKCDGYSNIIMIENQELLEVDLHINKILGCADALISDYSSVSIDYLILNRPIGFLLGDADAYAGSRGFVFDPLVEYLPGAELYTFEDMLRFVEEISNGIDSSYEKRQRLKEQLQAFDDDRSCERLVTELGIG